jgi:phage FluMu protein Com
MKTKEITKADKTTDMKKSDKTKKKGIINKIIKFIKR